MALAHAAAVAQAAVLLRSLLPSGHSAGGFGRFYMFTGLESGYESGDFNFGLWRNNNTVRTSVFTFNADSGAYPLPAAAAYGTAASLLELPTSAVGPVRSLGNLTVALFERKSWLSSSKSSSDRQLAGVAMTVVVVWAAVADSKYGTFDEQCVRVALPSDATVPEQGLESHDVVGAWTGLGEPIALDGPDGLTFVVSPLPVYLVVNASSGEPVVLALLSALQSCGDGSASCWC